VAARGEPFGAPGSLLPVRRNPEVWLSQADLSFLIFVPFSECPTTWTERVNPVVETRGQRHGNFAAHSSMRRSSSTQL
jgi:hypothetical protein